MSFENSSLRPPDSLLLSEEYRSSEGVRARFAVEQYTQPYIDLEAEFIYAVGIDKGKPATHLDMGASDLAYLKRLAIEFHLDQPAEKQSRYIAVEPNVLQYQQAIGLDQVALGAILHALGKSKDDHGLEQSIHLLPKEPVIEQYHGDANNIPSEIEKGSVDYYTMFKTGYHIPEKDQDLAVRTAKEFMKPDGIYGLSTSGQKHKSVTRLLEKEVADVLGILPPPRMNQGLTTERVGNLLPKHFNHVYMLDHPGLIVIDNAQAAFTYIRPAKLAVNLYDWGNRVPDKKAFDNAVDRIFKGRIENDLTPIPNNGVFIPGKFYDIASTSLSIASDYELDLDPKKFKKIK
jgi:hypothetical protein